MDYGKCASRNQGNPKPANLVSRVLALFLLAAFSLSCAGRNVEVTARGEMRTSIGVGQGSVK